MVMTKVAEMVTVTRNSAALVDPIATRAPRALTDKCGGHERPPTTPSNCVEETTEQSKQRRSSRLFHLTGASQRFPQNHSAHHTQINAHDGRIAIPGADVRT